MVARVATAWPPARQTAVATSAQAAVAPPISIQGAAQYHATIALSGTCSHSSARNSGFERAR